MASIVGVVGGIFGIVALAAAITVYFRMGMAKTTIELYRADNEALRTRLDTIEQERNETRMQLQRAEGKISALEEERTVLRDLVTGKSAVETMHVEMVKHFKDVTSLLTKITEERRA